ncbi:MAG: RICIN domain-containing protein, partial [Clostridia bacterium]|nr:RICIN domain-containing protein [Clostridia bacterium]
MEDSCELGIAPFSEEKENIELQSERLFDEMSESTSFEDFVGEKEFISSKHVERIKEKEELNTYVFLNSDGSESVYMMDENVKYISEDGHVFEKDISLVREDRSYKVNENEVMLSIPETAEDGIDFEYKDSALELVPQNGDENALAKLNETDNSITYHDYFGEGIDLRYTPILSGIKEDIILSSYTGENSFTFVLNTNGLKLFSEDGRYYVAAEEDSEDKINLGEIIVYDAVGRPDKGTLEIETVSEGEEYILTVSANESFLTDLMTVYPVIIDPTLEICDNIQGFGSIEDATVFSGYPDQNFGDYQYCSLGTMNSDYGVARTLVRFRGLSESDIYKSLSGDDITKAEFYVKEATGTASKSATLCYCSDGDRELYATWNRLDGAVSDAISAASLVSNEWTSFDITYYVKQCKAGKYNMSYGLIMKLSSNETSDFKQYDSSEHVTAGFRPYLKITHAGDVSISLEESSIAIDEAANYTLTAATNPENLDITWKSSAPTVASVDIKGVVTAKKAGVVFIYAYIEGSSLYDMCTVYVTVADGVYEIQNMNSGMYLDVANNGVTNGTNVLLCDWNDYCYGLNQRWRIDHLGMGYYSIRPVHKLGSCLYTTGSNVSIYDSDTTQTLLATPLTKRWSIAYEVIEGTTEKGYVFRNTYSGSKALTYADVSGSNDDNAVVSARVLSDRKQYWTISYPGGYAPYGGVRLYDTTVGGLFFDSNCRRDVTITREMLPDESMTLSQLGIAASFYTFNHYTDQTFTWESSDTNVVVIENGNGKLHAVGVGTATITGSKVYNGDTFQVSFKVVVLLEDGTPYYIRNRTCRTYIQASGNSANMQYFSDSNVQQWEITHRGDGYYTIMSRSNNLVLSVNPNKRFHIDEPLVLVNYVAGNEDQLWQITNTKNGSYKISAKSTESSSALVATLADSDVGEPIVQGTYVDNSSYLDEWYLCISAAEPEWEYQGKDTSFCWATCAKIVASKYIQDPPVSMQTAAVYVKLGVKTDDPTDEQISEADESGTIEEAIEAAEYILGAKDMFYEADGYIYSESVLRQVLADGNIVVVSRGNYGTSENKNSDSTSGGRNGGHSIVVYGYYEIAEDSGVYAYRVLDPGRETEGEGTHNCTYEWLCNGNNGISNIDLNPYRDGFIWDGTWVSKKGEWFDD